MSDSGSVSGGDVLRVRGETVVKPIVYGNISQHFGKKREPDGHTHEWTVYVKPYNNEDMSSYVKKVQFRLHDSYANFNRVVSKPPYEVSETGWGEFEVQVKIHFHDAAAEKPVAFYHVLKLFHTPPGDTAPQMTSTSVVQGRKTVVSEVYDEIIFQVSVTM
jgi:YEATS domain-containing protein 4